MPRFIITISIPEIIGLSLFAVFLLVLGIAYLLDWIKQDRKIAARRSGNIGINPPIEKDRPNINPRPQTPKPNSPPKPQQPNSKR